MIELFRELFHDARGKNSNVSQVTAIVALSIISLLLLLFLSAIIKGFVTSYDYLGTSGLIFTLCFYVFFAGLFHYTTQKEKKEVIND